MKNDECYALFFFCTLPVFSVPSEAMLTPQKHK